MSKAYDDGLAQLWLADARDMSFLSDGSVDCIVTSPPYWSLRKYGEGAELVWDGERECEHVWGVEATKRNRWGLDKDASDKQISNRGSAWEVSQGQFCQLCGAWRGQLGLEPQIELYLDHLLQILDVECRRVLKDSGVMWVNMGDSYAGSGGASGKKPWHTPNLAVNDWSRYSDGVPTGAGLKPLDLCMIPARFALAMQQRGWYLRSVVPWLKQAAMPDSVQGDRWEKHRLKVRAEDKALRTQAQELSGMRPHSGYKITSKTEWANCPGCPKCLPNDGLILRHGNWRPGRSMEWLFLFSKTDDCYSDAEGVRKAHTETTLQRVKYGLHLNPDGPWAVQKVDTERMGERFAPPAGRNRRQSDWLYESLDAIIADHEREARRLKHLRDNGGLLWEDGEPLALLLNPKGYKEAHFATYPIAMVEPLIKAYTSGAGNCPKCGKAWVRVVEKQTTKPTDNMSQMRADQRGKDATFVMPVRYETSSNTLGWRPDCECNAGEPVPAIVCDPFVGSGTTCAAATKLGRRSIGVDCVSEYIELAIKRLGGPFTVEVEGVKMKQTGLFEGRE